MCDLCYENPMKWTIVPGDTDANECECPDQLLVPSDDINADAPAIEGWSLKEVNFNFFDPKDTGVAKTFIYEQPTPTFFIVQYRVTKHYGGPEEGGWDYPNHEKVGEVTTIKGERIHAESICRSLNRLARKDREGGRARWSSNDYPRLQFAVDRWPGQNEDLTRHHYC